jgi:hypothetical protein
MRRCASGLFNTRNLVGYFALLDWDLSWNLTHALEN